MKYIICILFLVSLSFPFSMTLSADYRLQSGDILEVEIMTKKDLTTKQPITPDGTISLPLIGRTQVNGKTLTELDSLLKEKFSSYIQNPQIVTILSITEEHAKATPPTPIFVALWDSSKNTVDVKKTESAAEAFAYVAGQPYTVTRATQSIGTTTNIQSGDILTITVGKTDTYFQKNWYKFLTATAIALGILNTVSH